MKLTCVKHLLLYLLLFLFTEVKSQTILSESFEGSFPPTGWTLANTGGSPWTQFTGRAVSGTKSMQCLNNVNATANAWAFTPLLNLSTNTFYRITYWYTALNSERIKITMGNEANISSQTTIIHDYPGIQNTQPLEGVDTISVPSSGNYSIGFNCYSFNNSPGVYIDSIVVQKINPAACTSIPFVGNVSGPISVAPGSIFPLSLSGLYSVYSGIQFQWQSSAQGINNFQDISGATTQVFNTSQNVSLDYRCVVICSNTGSTAISNVINIPLTNSGSLFRQKYLGGTDLNTHINGMFFLTPSTGFVAFLSQIGFTQDSGQTYTILPIPTVSNTDYNGYAVNLTFGFRVTGVHAFSTDSLLAYGDFGAEPSILFSADKGVHWKVVFHQPYNLDQDIGNSFFDMKFISGNEGIAINQKYIVETTDKGQTWVVKIQIPTYSSSQFAKLSAPSSAIAYAIAGNDLYKRIGGAWVEMQNPVSTNTGLNFNNISFSSNTTGYISRDDNYGVYKTIDGGITWIKMNDTIACPVFASDLYFINDSTGFACTKSSYDVLKTINSGVTWEVCKKNTSYQYESYGMERLFFLNDLTGWAGGRGEYLMLTTSGGNPTIPKAIFKIDTTNLTSSGTVNLINSSNAYYQYKWYKNGVLISSSFNTSYTHDIYVARDTIMLIVNNGTDRDTLVQYQDFPLYIQMPVITSFTPTSGFTNTVVTIAGIGFTGTTSVTFGGIPASSFVVNSNTSITATVSGGSSGDVIVTTANGTGTAIGFIFESQMPPVLAFFSPGNGPIGTTITINGNNFGTSIANNIVYFGRVKAPIISANSNQIVCVVPAGSSYDPISVVNISNHLSTCSFKPFNVTFPSNNVVSENSFESVFDIHVPAMNSIQWAPSSIIAGDVDGDGKNDLVTSVRSGLVDSIWIYRNNTTGGNISFGTKESIAVGSYHTAISDIDNDGMLDIAYVSPSGIGVLRNTSTVNNISFASPVFSPTVSGPEDISVRDLDGDGRPEIIVAGYNEKKMGILRNISVSPAVSFAPKMEFASGALEQTVATGDLDGDGKPDVAIGGEETLSIFKNTSRIENISFSPRIDIATTGMINKIFITDVDGDGKLDIIVIYSTTYTSFSVFKNTSSVGNISFASKIDFLGKGDLSYVGAIDNFTGDSLPDIFYGGYYNNLSYFQKNSSTSSVPNFFSAVGFNLGTNYSSMCASDFDGDGKPDVATADWNNTVNDFHIFKNKMGQLFSVDSNSIIISTPITNICANDSVTITANTTYVGSSISYQWVLNGIYKGTNSEKYTVASLNDNDKIYCIMTIDGTHTVQSNTITMSVNSDVTPGIAITTADTTICAGATATFTATVTNAGTSPLYQWQLNGINTGTNSNTFSSAGLTNNDQVTCILTSSAMCSSPVTISSNKINITVASTPGTPVVSITAFNTNICMGDTVTFTATPTNGGNNPNYQWQINGANAGNNSKIFTTNNLANGDIVRVILTSNLPCASPQAVTSNSVSVTVNSVVPSVSISSSSSTVCPGETIIFTATAINGGATSVFQWKRNGINVGANSSTYSDSTFVNGDAISVTLTSNATCAIPSLVNSNNIIITVASSSIASINISGVTLVTPGTSSEILTKVVNAGINPVYQWQDSTGTHSWMNIVGAISSTLNYIPLLTGDRLRCLLATNSVCTSSITTISNTLIFNLIGGRTEIHIYPNPVRDKIIIDSLNMDDKWQTLTVFSATGTESNFLQNIAGQTKIELDVSNLASGLYIGVLKNRKGDIIFFKFVKY